MKLIGWFLLGAVLALVVACLSCENDDDDSESNNDNPATWDCQEAWAIIHEECGFADAETACTDLFPTEDDWLYSEMRDCLISYWPDCENFLNCHD